MIDMVRIVESEGTAVVTATADFHPLREVKAITSRLHEVNFEGLVIFDLLSVNGLEMNRFATMSFSRDGFDRRSFLVDAKICTSIRRDQDLRAKSDKDFLLGAVLSTDEVKAFTESASSS